MLWVREAHHTLKGFQGRAKWVRGCIPHRTIKTINAATRSPSSRSPPLPPPPHAHHHHSLLAVIAAVTTTATTATDTQAGGTGGGGGGGGGVVDRGVCFAGVYGAAGVPQSLV